MIEIKRSCNSSIRNDLEKRQIIFGAFTIRITDEDWQFFDYIRVDLGLKPDEVLHEILDAGLMIYNSRLRRIDRS